MFQIVYKYSSQNNYFVLTGFLLYHKTQQQKLFIEVTTTIMFAFGRIILQLSIK